MINITLALKDRIGYTTDNPPRCRDCKFCDLDREGKHGKGGVCVRNPDVTFIASGNARCDKFSLREAAL